ncbi:Sulfite reductase [NADPH] flavoprotein alpha-component [Dickeya dianthicola]|uniref:Flavodoxin n=1 Tax=Dickeya dianthicola TaxID=204039 RepID=A0AAP2G8L1_9GAMM|nr:flavodoxin [Dickeya dianthicola]ATO31937.1 putative flavoprotein YqcA (clustered wit tRNA pseudouridine synthase C) [Dickeya dianthicola RNS04.9]AYC17954.1 Sulfite reductase [NADPH] flavoprotein alpha-component [Dickeya dianthicola]MBI0438604.1 flavodoxin [Dickeya dianthicola]MBI0448871.1 flavodoxin [Dickeya dianthicola]MBI0453402.1 flavodoxin [Dickeya dianthicola]
MAQVGIFVGTVYGNALLVAEEAESLLKAHGHEVKIFEEASVDDWLAYSQQTVLVVTSTTGQGQLPESIVPLYEALREKVGYQPDLRYGLIALGDSSYDNFCGGGHQFDALLQEMGAKRVGELLEIDATEHPEPEVVSCPWVESWATLLNT